MYRTKSAGDNAEQTQEIVTAELKRIGDEVKSAGEKALSEAKKAGDVSAETKESVDKLLVKQGELQARLQEAEQKLDRRGSGDDYDAPLSAGAEFAQSEEFKAFVADGNMRRDFTYRLKATVMTTGAAPAGALVAPDRQSGIVGPGLRRMTIRDLITPGTTGSNLVQYVRESGFTDGTGMVAEGGAKPASDISFELKNAAVVKIATHVKASTEILADAAMLQSYIDGRLRYMLALKEENQLLNGPNNTNNLHGIYTQATAYSAPITVADATDIDTLRLALLQAELAEFPSTGIVMHPSNWAGIELMKDAGKNYLFSNPQGVAQPALWGRPVVSTQAMTGGKFLVGAFQLGAQLFDRMQASIAVATENEDDFLNNLVTILIEERLALAVYRPEAFVKGDISAIN